ncbi:MAG: iron-sulfur cluster carrier protein ApbC [Rhodobiaceae bacterium]|nr:iron-sulfur cluster carrier protein ApbC [Rhodobiaceae bacterium]
MSSDTQALNRAVVDALKRVAAPGGRGNIVSRGLISDVVTRDGKVYLSISVDPAEARGLEPMREAAERAVAGIVGAGNAVVSLTAEKPASQQAPQATQQPRPQRGGAVPGIDRIIAVASGKGGVGKSTTAVNLALALQALGVRVGLLDADIYGPSQPRLLGLKGKPELAGGKIMKPHEKFGLKVMSIGFLVEEDTPMIWRGPMVISALTQMLREVAWGDLDVLVVDMPPGTGDAQLTMAQQVPLAGAVIVSTPQDLALIDARKGINMFRRVEVPILGIIENMSYFLCPSCGTRSDIFGTGGAHQEAERLGVPFLGGVPLHMDIRESSDSGLPCVATDPEGSHATIYKDIAAGVLAALGAGAVPQAPKIVME